MNPPDITPYLLEADRQRPDLARTNTMISCGELLALTLALAGPEWAWVGKTRDMDGASVTPPGFVSFDVALLRPDGQQQVVHIGGVGMDAAWHLPTMRQVKVIANSTANEPGPHEHGPARLTPYVIEPQYYRWHNPPVPQFGAGKPMPRPVPVPGPVAGVLPKPEAFAFLKALDAFYRAPDGLQRADGLCPDVEGVAQWFYQGVIEGKSIEDVKAQIRQSDEWRAKHP